MRGLKLIPGHYYHIYNRGVNREKIFFNPENWHFFPARLRQYFLPEHVVLLAYCLMPNHYHLLIKAVSEFISEKVFQPFGTSYVKAINKQQHRVGPLFQNRYQARLVEDSADLLNLSRYIHLNPTAAGLVELPLDWEFSSCQDYLGFRRDSLLDTNLILSLAGGKAGYAEFVLNSSDNIEKLVKSTIIDQSLPVISNNLKNNRFQK